MTLVRWDPFRTLRMFGDFNAPEEGYGAWMPPVDIFERGEDLVIRAELPGVSRDDIDVRVENGTLFLCGERKREQELTENHTYRVERAYGSFTRSFSLPTSVDASKIAASYRDGVLDIVLPKAEEAKPKKIRIQAA